MERPRFEALLFGPGDPPQGQRVRVEPRSRGLALQRASGDELEVAYAQLRLRGGGWRGATLLLDWDGDGGACALSVDDPAALAVLRTHVPEPLRSQLGRTRGPSRRPPLVLGVGAALLMGSMLLLAVMAFSQVDRLVDVAVRRIPVTWEAELGELTVQQLTATRPVVRTGDAARVVEELGTRLSGAIDSPYTFRWILVDDPTINALAAPGGYVVVFTGLVRAAETPEEVAGVLAHEVQHVVLRHSLRGIVRSLGWRAIIGIVFGGAGELGGMMGTMVEQLGSLGFSRQDEAEADAEGVNLLHAAGIRADGMATFFERLAERGGEPPAFLSTHPSSADRARRIRELAASAPVAPALGYDWDVVRASAGRVATGAETAPPPPAAAGR